MTKSKFFKLFCVILAVITVFSSSSIIANAQENEDDGISLYYTTISGGTCQIYISGVTAHCSGTLTAKSSTSLKIKLEIQKKKSSGYETVETWTGSKTGVSLAVSGTRTINVLSTYRLKATYTAGSETIVQYDYP